MTSAQYHRVRPAISLFIHSKETDQVWGSVKRADLRTQTSWSEQTSGQKHKLGGCKITEIIKKKNILFFSPWGLSLIVYNTTDTIYIKIIHYWPFMTIFHSCFLLLFTLPQQTKMTLIHWTEIRWLRRSILHTHTNTSEGFLGGFNLDCAV